jgi:hypothetical protein
VQTVVTRPPDAASASKMLPWAVLLYAAASLAHFAHNAEYLADYPNLPSWLTRYQIYLAWACISAVGVVGYVLYRGSHRLVGLILLAVYSALGFDGLLHYGRAPVAAHTSAMNLTIWFEVLAAGLLLIAVVALARKHLLRSG